MAKNRCNRSVAFCLLLSAATPVHCWARNGEDAEPFSDAAAPAGGLAQSNVQALDRGRYPVPEKARSAAIDWGTGAFALRGERIRSGSKSSPFGEVRRQWLRSFAANAQISQNAIADLSVAAGASLASSNRGAAGEPVLNSPTQAHYREAYFAIQRGDQLQAKFRVFDLGGWSPDNLSDSINRLTNGETRARNGIALDLARLAPSKGNGWQDPYLDLHFERSTSRATGAATSAELALVFGF
jgi:hypothetical protein